MPMLCQATLSHHSFVRLFVCLSGGNRKQGRQASNKCLMPFGAWDFSHIYNILELEPCTHTHTLTHLWVCVWACIWVPHKFHRSLTRFGYDAFPTKTARKAKNCFPLYSGSRARQAIWKIITFWENFQKHMGKVSGPTHTHTCMYVCVRMLRAWKFWKIAKLMQFFFIWKTIKLKCQR